MTGTVIVLASAFLLAQAPKAPEQPAPLTDPAEPDDETAPVTESPSENEEVPEIEEPPVEELPLEEIPVEEIPDEEVPVEVTEAAEPLDLEELPPLEEPVESADFENPIVPEDPVVEPLEEIPVSEEPLDVAPDDDGDIETLAPVVVIGQAENGSPAVFGAPLAVNPLLQFSSPGTTVIGGAELRRKVGTTLGATLASEPGISASSYSPGVSRPIIRGFEGVRVRTLRDGLGTMDLSEDSPDHGVLIDTLLTEEVEIHRGPGSLLFGNSAIGGVINTRTRYIPSVANGEPLAATAIAGYDTQGNGYHFATAAELRFKNLAFGFSVSERSAGDISIPGRARTSRYEELEQPQVFVPGVGAVAVPNPKGTLPNSFHDSSSWSLGARLGSEDSFSIGLSHHHFESSYGIPYSFPGDEVDFFGDFSIDAELDRTDLELSYRAEPDSWLRKAGLRLGFGDYAHAENFDGQGKDAGTRFTETAFQRDTFEARLDFYHGEEDDAFSGVFGAHFVDDNVAVTRLVVPPPTLFEEDSVLESRSLGLFALEKWKKGSFSLQAGLRWDQTEVSLTDQLGSVLSEKAASFSQSLSASYEFTELGPFDYVKTSLTASRIERLPTAIERYAFYNNAAIGRFLIGGDLDGEQLEKEVSMGLELSLEAERGIFSSQFSAFYYRFDNFTYLEDQRGISIMPTAEYEQAEADFYGVEASAKWRLLEDEEGWGTFDLRLVGDVIRSRNFDRNDEPLPRMPAARLGFELTWENDRWSTALEGRYVFAQNRTAPFPTQESSTEDYLMVNASISWLPLKDSEDLRWSLRLNNLLNAEARDHTSFRKETNPLPGFGLSTELRWVF